MNDGCIKRVRNDLLEAQAHIITSVTITVAAAVSITHGSDDLDFCGVSSDDSDEQGTISLPKQATARRRVKYM